jgi:hypothetical protein
LEPPSVAAISLLRLATNTVARLDASLENFSTVQPLHRPQRLTIRPDAPWSVESIGYWFRGEYHDAVRVTADTSSELFNGTCTTQWERPEYDAEPSGVNIEWSLFMLELESALL